MFVSDCRRRDLCPAVCPFWLVAKVFDWPGVLTARMMSVYVNDLLRDQRLVDVREVVQTSHVGHQRHKK